MVLTPIGILEIHRKSKNGLEPEPPEPIYGGYSNGYGEISLFGKSIVYRVNFKNRTIQQRPGLNSGAQARHDTVQAGEPFEYCNKSFLRLANEQILEICASGAFRITARHI